MYKAMWKYSLQYSNKLIKQCESNHLTTPTNAQNSERMITLVHQQMHKTI